MILIMRLYENFIIVNSLKELYGEYLTRKGGFSFSDGGNEILMTKDNGEGGYYSICNKKNDNFNFNERFLSC